MAIEKVREYFRQYGLEERVQEFEVSSATVELAAQAVGCEPKRIAKTLSFKVDDGCVLIVTAGDAKIDNVKYKGTFHTKSKNAVIGGSRRYGWALCRRRMPICSQQ